MTITPNASRISIFVDENQSDASSLTETDASSVLTSAEIFFKNKF